MGENRFFNVESKSFEIVKNSIELSIIERSRNHFSIVTMGFVAALWLRDALLEVTKLSNDQNLFRSFREGNKIFVLQKQKNGKGRFVTITALGDTKSKGYVIIPEGRGACGWTGLSHKIHGIMGEKAHGKREVDQRRPEIRHHTAQGNHTPNLVKESQTFKDAVTQGDLPKISVGIAGNQEAVSQICNGSNTNLLELSLKVLLGTGPRGEWVVQWAGVVNCEATGPNPQQNHGTMQPVTNLANGPHATTTRPNDNTKPVRPTTQSNPKPRMVWKPRVNGSNGSTSFQKLAEDATGQTTANHDDDRLSLHSWDSDSQLSSIPAQPTSSQPIAEVIAEVGEVDRSWGSSRDWFIDLRDGRRLRLPADLRSPIADMGRTDDVITQKLVQWVSSQRDAIETDDEVAVSEGGLLGSEDGSESVGVISEYTAAESIEGNEKNMSMVLTEETEVSESVMLEAVSGAWGEFLENTEVSDGVGDTEQKELVPLNVEPLAVAFPVDVENHGSTDDGSFVSQSSDWVQRRQKAIGKVLGANYEGYEQAVTALLMDIEARHLQRKATMTGVQKPMSSGRKGTRELKRLASSINYEARATREDKGKGKMQGGVAIVDQ
jgi:hypothetical protein